MCTKGKERKKQDVYIYVYRTYHLYDILEEKRERQKKEKKEHLNHTVAVFLVLSAVVRNSVLR